MTNKNPVLVALAEYGTSEIVGGNHNIKILKYFEESGHAWVKDDETAWCAAFQNAILKRCGLPTTGRLNARSFLEIGIETNQPELGDIVVLWRIAKSSPFGHCGFFISKDANYVYILGGNQTNTVNIQKFPVNQVLGYRKLTIEA